MKTKIKKSLLVERLGHYLNQPCTEEDLAVLIYGWTRHDEKYRQTITHRSWLYAYEVAQLSEYAGCNLTDDAK